MNIPATNKIYGGLRSQNESGMNDFPFPSWLRDVQQPKQRPFPIPCPYLLVP